MAQINWVLDPGKCLTPAEVRRLRCVSKKHARAARAAGKKVPVRDHFIVELALATGLRVMEITRLRCGDVFADKRQPWLIVRAGKGGRRRVVWFSTSFGQCLDEYLDWKTAAGEPVGQEDPLLRSSNTGNCLTTRAVQKAFKRCAARAGLPSRYSIHGLRHTYACALYKASGYNLRLVQKQLGHARIVTTQVYADVMAPDVRRALERLYR
jgi:integrase/recombinase XerC/integrase/recombinase XerD